MKLLLLIFCTIFVCITQFTLLCAGQNEPDTTGNTASAGVTSTVRPGKEVHLNDLNAAPDGRVLEPKMAVELSFKEAAKAKPELLRTDSVSGEPQAASLKQERSVFPKPPTQDLCTTQNRCLNGGECKQISATETSCTCDQFNFYGEYCQFTKGCQTFPCQNGGTCSTSGKDSTCQCPHGFTDPNCSTRDPCVLDSISCLNNGWCERLSNKHAKCNCPEGWLGERCEIRKPCQPGNPCLNSGGCTATSDGYDFICSCASGFYGKICEFRDPCVMEKVSCSGRGTCERISDTEWRCRCQNEDYYGKNCETERPKNLCETIYAGKCLNNGKCHAESLALGIKCLCPLGYSGAYCEKFNSCELPKNRCHNGGTCIQIDGSETTECGCQPSFSGKNCEHYSACASSPCLHSTGCEDVRNDYYCNCMNGWQGRQCTIQIAQPPTSSDFVDNFCLTRFYGKCTNGATCISFGENEYECVCPPGFSGKDCAQGLLPVKPQKRFTDNQAVQGPIGRAVSPAPAWATKGWIIGPQRPLSRGRAITSGAGAPAVPPTPTGCVSGAPCDFCATKHAGVCLNGGVCITATATETYYECACKATHEGKNCENAVLITACTMNPCEHGGLCVLHPTDGTFHCDCRAEYVGELCKERDPCKLGGDSDCLNGGTCVRENDVEYTCKCRIPFVGDQCEIEDLCTIDPGECIDDIVEHPPMTNCFPCLWNETCERFENATYNCDGHPVPELHKKPTPALPPKLEPFAFAYPKAARVNQEVPFLMRFPETSMNLHWYFDDEPYVIIDVHQATYSNCNLLEKPHLSAESDSHCSFIREFYKAKSYAVKVDSTGDPKPPEKMPSITIYDNCIPYVRIHNIGHTQEQDYPTVEKDPIDVPLPQFQRDNDVVAWATIHMDCEPENLKVQICSLEFQWELDGKPVQGQTSNTVEISTNSESLSNFGIHTLSVVANITFTEKKPDCSNEECDRITALVTDSGSFEIKVANPVAIIAGGSYRVVSKTKVIYLDGTKSYDPEDVHKIYGLKFEWTCSFDGPTGPGPCDKVDGIFTADSTCNITFHESGTYTFTLEVKSRIPGAVDQKDKTEQTIQVVDADVPELTTSCVQNCGKEINRENMLVLKCECKKCSLRKEQWDIQVNYVNPHDLTIPPQPVKHSKTFIEDSVTGTGYEVYVQIDPDPSDEVINKLFPGHLDPDPVLNFYCSAKLDKLMGRSSSATTAKIGQSRSSHHPLTDLPKPLSLALEDACKIIPESDPAYAFKTKFILRCDEFYTPDPPLTFTVYAKLRAEFGRGRLHEYEYEYGYPVWHETTTLLLPESTAYAGPFSHYEFVLPAGHPRDGYRLPLTVKISGVRGRAVYIRNTRMVVKPIETPLAELLDWYLEPRGKFANAIAAHNHVSVLQHALAYFHYASVADPLTITPQEKKELTKLKTIHIDQLLKMSRRSFSQVEHVNSVAFAIIHGDRDKPQRALSGTSLLLGTRLVEGLSQELQRILRKTPRTGSSSASKTDFYDDPAVEAMIKSGVLSVMGLIGPLNTLHHEFFLDDEYSTSIAEFRFLPANLNSVNSESPKILEALNHLAECFGSRMSITHNPIAYPPKGFFGIFVQIIHETWIAGRKAPYLDHPELLPSLLRENYVELSPKTSVKLSPGNTNKLVQIVAIVSMFNPYLKDKIRTDDINLQVNIEAPLFVLEVQDDYDSKKLNHNTDTESPHVFQLTFFDVDHTASNILAREPGQINIDVFSVPDVDRHEFLVSLPPHSTFMVGVDVYGVKDVDLYIAMTKNERPSCHELEHQATNNARIAFGDRVGGVAYEMFTSNLDSERSSDEPLSNENCPKCNDYYIIMWPTPATNIPASMKKNKNDSLDVLIGFSHLKCFTRQEITGSSWKQDCKSGPSRERDFPGMTCSCQHMSIIGGSLIPIAFSNQDFLKIDLFSNLSDGIIIPYVVISLLILYAILLVICIYVDAANHKRPKLIVMGDLQRLRTDAFYLLTVETGNDWFGGTTAKVLCQVFGENAQTKPMVLSNYILDTMRENDEQSFLISSPQPLGKILRIKLSHDNSGPTPSWFCRRVIIRDIRTEETWFFFVERWLSTWKGSASLSCKVDVGTPEEVAKRFANKFTFRGYWKNIREHHLWISFITCPARSLFTRSERITCGMVAICCYMIFNLILYKIPSKKYDGGIISFEYVHIGQYDPVFSNGTKASLCGVWFGILVAEAFKLIRRRMLPVLVVFDADTRKDVDSNGNTIEIYQGQLPEEPEPETKVKPHVETKVTPKASSRLVKEVLPVIKKSVRKIFPERSRVIMPVPLPEPVIIPANSCGCSQKKSNHLLQESCFRVPSTDIVKTEKWIAGMCVDQESIVRHLVQTFHYEDHFVHRYCHPERVKCTPKVNKTYLSRAPTQPYTRRDMNSTATYIPEQYRPESYQTHLRSHRYYGCKPNEQLPIPYSARVLSILTETLADPVQKQLLCPKCECGAPRPMATVIRTRIEKCSTQSVICCDPVPPVKPVTPCPSRPKISCRDVCVSCMLPLPKEEPPLVGRPLENPDVVKYELGSILYHYQRAQCLPYRPFIYVAWCLCLSLIAVCSTLTIYYGYRFGWIKSIDWCISCLYTFAESIVIIQPLKCLIYYGISLICARKHHLNADQVTVKTRFKLLWMSGRTTSIKIWPLNYLIHPLRIQEISGLPKDYVITKSGFHSTGIRHRRYSDCQISSPQDPKMDRGDSTVNSKQNRKRHHSADDIQKNRGQAAPGSSR